MLTESGAYLDARRSATTTASRDFPEAAKKSAPGRVLVVDDEALVRWMVVQTLEPLGYDVVEAGTGADAARIVVEESPFDAVLLDLQLPDISDLRLLSLVRQVAPNTPVVLMSAFATPEVEAEASGLGAASVLHKPFELPALVSLIDILGRDERSDDPRR